MSVINPLSELKSDYDSEDAWEEFELPLSQWKSGSGAPQKEAFFIKLNSDHPLYNMAMQDWEQAELAKELEDLKKGDFYSKENLMALGMSETRAAQKAQEMQAAQKTQETQAPQGILPEKVVLKPIEQLSIKGLAIMSHIYAVKDKNERQPLIVSTTSDFKRLIQLIDNAPEVEVTIILQLTDNTREGVRFHRTALKIKKTGSDLKMINMDGVGGVVPGIARDLTIAALQENRGNSTQTIFSFAAQTLENKPKPEVPAPESRSRPKTGTSEYFVRQKNGHECGIFAIKDARQMNRDSDFVKNIINDGNRVQTYPAFTRYEYKIPAEYLKSMQSRTYAAHTMPEHGEKIVTRKGASLKKTYEKHGDQYTHHFSEKFHGLVLAFVQKEENKPRLKEIVEYYDAGKITQEGLEKRYGLMHAKTEVKEIMAMLETKDAKDNGLSIHVVTDSAASKEVEKQTPSLAAQLKTQQDELEEIYQKAASLAESPRILTPKKPELEVNSTVIKAKVCQRRRHKKR